MGGFLTGLMGTVGTGLREKNRQHQDEQAKQKERQLDTQWTAMQSAVGTLDRLKRKQDSGEQLTAAEIQEAQNAAGVWQSSQGEYAKLTKSNKPVNEAFQRVGGFVQKLLTSKRNQLAGPQQRYPMDEKLPDGTPAMQAGTKPVTAPPKVQGVNPAVPNITQPQQGGTKLTAPPPIQKQQQSQVPNLDSKQQAMLYASPQYADQQKEALKQIGEKHTLEAKEASALDQQQKEFDAWTKRGKDLGLTGRDLAEYAGSSGAKLPPQQKRVVEKQIGRPGEDPGTGKPYEGLWDHTLDPDGTETWAKHTTPPPKGSGQIRSVPHSVSVMDAISTAKQGAVYKDQSGNDIDLEKLPPSMGLQAMVVGEKMFWVPISPTQSELTVGNEKYVVTPYNKDVAHGAGVAQGPARVGTVSTPTQVVTDAQGVPHVLGSTSTPVTTGARPSSGPTATPPGGGTGTQKQAPAPGARSSAPPMQGVPIGMYNQMLQRVTPVREAATQVFGDPSQPDLKPLKDYITLADNKEARERLGSALRLTFDGLNQASGGGNVAVGAGPVSVSAGGVGQWLQNVLHVPQGVAAQQTKIMQDAVAKLTPDEREYYDSVMSAFSTVVGLRSLTRASAAQSSVNAIERELPIIGVNTTDSKQFADQMQRLAEVVYNGTKGVPAGMFDPAMVERVKNLPSEMQKLKSGSKASPSGTLNGPAKKISSKAEYNTLPKGASYIDADGKTYVKQ